LPVLSKAKIAAQKAKAKTELADIVNAINAYDTDYGRFPISPDEQTAAYAGGNNDFTSGLIASPQNNSFITWPTGSGGHNSFDSNSNIVAILMDLTAYPSGVPTCNTNHVKNPKQVKYLNAKMSGYDPGTPGNGQQNPPGGVDRTGIYRDPWGNPYIITMDTSYDDQCSDLYYCQQNVSQSSGQTGYNGLFNPNANPSSQAQKDSYLYHGKVMAWSAGPDGQIDNAATSAPANQGHNKDNVLSWQ